MPVSLLVAQVGFLAQPFGAELFSGRNIDGLGHHVTVGQHGAGDETRAATERAEGEELRAVTWGSPLVLIGVHRITDRLARPFCAELFSRGVPAVRLI